MQQSFTPWNWPSYLRWMFASLVIVIATVGLINAVIDPLGIFHSPKINRINAIKPYLDHHREFARYKRAVSLCADTAIFGNSRAEIGFDPESPALRAQGLSAFNHAIPGTGGSTSLQQLLWLEEANCPPKTIILGVEFFDFLGGSEKRPLPTLISHPAPQSDLRFFAESVFSISGLRDSLTTLWLQHARYPATLTERGFDPLLNYIPEVAQSGHYLLFRQRAEENVRNWRRKSLRIDAPNGGVSDDEAVLDAFLAKASQSGSTTYIVIYPYHAEIRLMMEQLGLGQLFADWKRLVVKIAERNMRQGGKIQVWDFSGISAETVEAIPLKGDTKTQLAYYWEAGHFKKELGELMFERLLEKPGAFGVRLGRDNIESWLVEDCSRVQALVNSTSPLVQEVDSLFATATK